VLTASGDERLEECRREATTQHECSCVACQNGGQSHAAIVPPSSGSKRHASRSQKAQTAFLASYQHHLHRADLHQMVLHRPIECTSIKGEVKKKHFSAGWKFSCFAAHTIEQDLF
jgi:hypothetical protein